MNGLCRLTKKIEGVTLLNAIVVMIKLQEFNRLRSSLRAKKEHASLLDDFREFDRGRLDLEEGGSYEQAALLNERAAISRGSGQVHIFIRAITLENHSYFHRLQNTFF